MSVLLLAETTPLVTHDAPSLFGGAPRFVRRRCIVRARIYGQGVRFIDEGDVDLLRAALRPQTDIERIVDESAEGALADIVARHLLPKPARPIRPLSLRLDTLELAARFAAHLAGDDALDLVVASHSLHENAFGRALVAALDATTVDLVHALSTVGDAPVVIASALDATVVHDGAVLGGGPPSQAAAFASGLAPFVLRQLAQLAGTSDALAQAFDSFSLAVALGRTEERILRSLERGVPCVLGGERAPLFLPPCDAHFSLPSSLVAAIDAARKESTTLPPTLVSLLDARTRERERLLQDAAKLCAFESELRLPPLDDLATWFEKSPLAVALHSALPLATGTAGLSMVGRAPALRRAAGEIGVPLAPLHARWLRSRSNTAANSVSATTTTLSISAVSISTPPSEPAPSEREASAAAERPDVPVSTGLPPETVPLQNTPLERPVLPRVIGRELPAEPPRSELTVAPLPTSSMQALPAKPAAASASSSSYTSSIPELSNRIPVSEPSPRSPPQPTRTSRTVPSHTRVRAAPVPRQIAEDDRTAPATDHEHDATPRPVSAGDLFRDPHRVPVPPGFDFDTLQIVVDGRPVDDAKSRVGRVRSGLAASVPEARGGSMVWLEGELSLGTFDTDRTGDGDWPTLGHDDGAKR